ncbi:MAG: WD40 repeat domain-containing protein, partial [Myxococcota bacterium]
TGVLLGRHRTAVTTAEFAPDGATAATSSRDRSLSIWRPDDPVVPEGQGNAWRTFEDSQGEIWAMSFSEDGRYLATGGIDNGVYFWDLKAKTALRAVRHDHEGWIGALAWSKDERVIASASWDNTIGLFRANDLNPLFGFEQHTDYVVQVLFVPDSPYLISASYDRTVAVWDWRNAELITVFNEHEDWIHALRWMGEGLFASASSDRSVRLWSTETLSCVAVLDEGSSEDWMSASLGATSSLSSWNASYETGYSDRRARGLPKVRADDRGVPREQVLDALATTSEVGLDEVSAFVEERYLPSLARAHQTTSEALADEDSDVDLDFLEGDDEVEGGEGLEPKTAAPPMGGAQALRKLRTLATRVSEASEVSEASSAEVLAQASEGQRSHAKGEDDGEGLVRVTEARFGAKTLSKLEDLHLLSGEAEEFSKSAPTPVSTPALSMHRGPESSSSSERASVETVSESSQAEMELPSADSAATVRADVPVESEVSRERGSIADFAKRALGLDRDTVQGARRIDSLIEQSLNRIGDLDVHALSPASMLGESPSLRSDFMEENLSWPPTGEVLLDVSFGAEHALELPESPTDQSDIDAIVAIESGSLAVEHELSELSAGLHSAPPHALDPSEPDRAGDVKDSASAQVGLSGIIKRKHTVQLKPGDANALHAMMPGVGVYSTREGREAVHSDSATSSDEQPAGARAAHHSPSVDDVARTLDPPDENFFKRQKEQLTRKRATMLGMPDITRDAVDAAIQDHVPNPDSETTQSSSPERSLELGLGVRSPKPPMGSWLDISSAHEERANRTMFGVPGAKPPDESAIPELSEMGDPSQAYQDTFEVTVAEIWQMRLGERKAAMKIFKRRQPTPGVWRRWGRFESIHPELLAIRVEEESGIFVTSGRGRSVELWSVEAGQLMSLPTSGKAVTAVTMTSDRRVVAAGDDKARVHLWLMPQDLLAKSRDAVGHAILTGHAAAINSVAVNSTGKRLLTGSDNGTAKLWSLEDGSCLFTLTGHDGPVTAVEFATRGPITAGADGSVRHWDRSGAMISRMDMRAPVVSVTYRKGITYAADMRGRVMMHKRGKDRDLFVHQDGACALRINDEDVGLVVAPSGRLAIFEAVRGEILQELDAVQALTSGDLTGNMVLLTTRRGEIEVFKKS